jgi:phage baseplate assembly protein gpV
MNEQAIADILDRLRNRFFGKYRGTVTEVDAATLRIKAKVPTVLGEQTTGWCMPCVPYAGPSVGMAFLPEVGAGVWIEFEAGDVSYPVWVGCYWRDGEAPSDATPSVKAIITKAGHKILLDDAGATVTLSDPNNNTVTLGADGITISRGGSKIEIGDAEVNINDGALEVI